VTEQHPCGAPEGFGGRWGNPDADLSGGFPRLAAQLRVFQDAVAAANPPEDVLAELGDLLAAQTDRLGVYAVDEWHQLFGRVRSVPGRAQTMAPVFTVDEVGTDRVSGRVTLGRFYLGGNGAAHGGVLPLLFDEVLGRLANTGGRPPSRTAYLHVDFRSITPIGPELRVAGWFDREQGRKRYLRASVHHGDVLCAEAEGLFVQLLPGQP